MNNQFDELAKGLAQSVTRREAFKKFGVGLAGVALACFGLADVAKAVQACLPVGSPCDNDKQCCSGYCYRDNGGRTKNPLNGFCAY